MKRLACCVMVMVLLAAMFPVFGNAAAYGEEVVTEVFADGSYETESIYKMQTRAGGTISGSKVRNHYDTKGTLCWQFVLNGSFSYTGSSATCTSSTCSVSIYSQGWYVISKNASKSGNTASANATMGESSGGVLANRVSASLTLRCDKNGNLS